MTSIIKPGALCFDIGAHHGESAEKLIDQYGAGHVVCVEPNLKNYLKLLEKWHGDPRVTCIHAAISDHAGLALISHAAAQDGLCTMALNKWSTIYPDADFQPPELVPALTLAMIEAEFGTPDYLKVDVEGVELAVLQGLTGRPTFVSFEFHGAYITDAVACMDLLHARGYTKASYVEEDIELVDLPVDELVTVRAHLALVQPNWGNITVC